MNCTGKQGPEGLWNALTEMEATADRVLTETLKPFEAAFRSSYEAGVQAPTLIGRRHKQADMMAAAPFLKRTLNDLRCVWILLLRGYTSQAAAVAASLFENALATFCLAGDERSAGSLESEPSHDIPWSPKEMVKKWAAVEERAGTREYELRWREAYGAYKWLCKIKHPTQRSALHDTIATRLRDEYVVMAAPNLASEDQELKATVAALSLSRALQAIGRFAEGLDPEKATDEYRQFDARIAAAGTQAIEAFKAIAKGPLPFDISDSRGAQEWRQVKDGG